MLVLLWMKFLSLVVVLEIFDFSSCLKLEAKDDKWVGVARMNDARSEAACAVFEGKIIVSGGKNNINLNGVNTVEMYDHITNTWSFMPNMIKRRVDHSSAAINNKLFVFGSRYGNGKETFEVFDSTCKKFVIIKQKPNSFKLRLNNIAGSFCIEGKFVLLGNWWSSTALCYDVDKDEWSEEPFEATRNTAGYGCSLVPRMDI